MGLRDIWRNWTKGEDRRAVERAEDEARLTPVERSVADEDFEARKDDLQAFSSPPGAAAADTAGDDLDTP
jgi:uncharacterized alpha-E superfamily protein